MDSKQFISYLEVPSKIPFEDIKALQKYTSEFPFCQSVQILYSLYLSLKSKNKNEEFMQKAFLYTSNNIHLIELKDDLFANMQNKDLEPPKPSIAKTAMEIKKKSSILDKEEKAIETKTKEEVKEDIKKDSIEKPKFPSKKDIPRGIGEDKVKKIIEKIKPGIKEETIIKKEIRDQIQKKEKSPEPEKDKKTITAVVNKETKPIVKTVTKEKELSAEEKKKQLQEIIAKRLNKIGDKNKSENEKPKILTKTDNAPPKIKQEEIINKFITEEPSIGPIKKEDTEIDIEKARKSMELDDNIISETLAKIYASQGNNIRAIELYEKLSLKYPEKSTYFAAQIESLKNKK